MKKSPFSKKSIIAWCLYDWANSAYSVIILTFVFATYFTQKIAPNTIEGTSLWGETDAMAGLVIALISPVLGAIADRDGRRKPWIAVCSLITIIASALLWFAKPETHYVTWTLVWMGVGLIGLEVSMVYYNAMLPELAPKRYLGRVSGWGWGAGYFGGLASLLIALFLFMKSNFSWLDQSTSEQIRICGPLVAVWYLLFAWPLFVWTKDQPATGVRYRDAVRAGLRQLFSTLRQLPKHKEILKFLLARMIYIDAVNTIFAFGGIYAAGTFHMTFTQILEFAILMNIAAGLGAVGFAWLDDGLGAKPTILISLVIMIISGTGMVLATTQQSFWIFGIFLSICVGPVQAASRSLMAHLAPAPLMTEMFGLYAFSGKATAFIGPWLVALFTDLFKSQRVGMSTVMWFLLIGALLLLTVRVKKVT